MAIRCVQDLDGNQTFEEYDEIQTQDQLKEIEKANILAELSQLDEVMPRVAEDIINAMAQYDNLPQIVKDRFDRKQELRNILRDL